MRNFIIFSVVATLSACGGVAPNELQIDDDGDGRFSGLAGPDWTAAEVQNQVNAIQCGGSGVTGFSLRTLDGGAVFSGRCAAGAVPVAATPAPQTVTTAPTAPRPAGQSTYVSPYATDYVPPEGFYAQ